MQQSSEIDYIIICSFVARNARPPLVTLGLISSHRGVSKILMPVKKRFVLPQSLSSYGFRCVWRDGGGGLGGGLWDGIKPRAGQVLHH